MRGALLGTILLLTTGTTIADTGCVDLTGRFRFAGSWERQESEGQHPDDLAVIRKANPVPRFDTDILGRSITLTAGAMARLATESRADGVHTSVELTWPGMGSSTHDMPFSCVGGQWVREWTGSAGNDGAFTRTKSTRRLWLDANGDLLAEGRSDWTKGLIFKSTAFSEWQARFPRLP